MYTIEKHTNFLELKDAQGFSKAQISLNEGGRLKNLSFNNSAIINDDLQTSYQKSYASSILFPFANRIENGIYLFEEKKYRLDCNQGKNAIHGLVFDKKFELINQKTNQKSCTVTLNYTEKKGVEGFPFLYEIFLRYKLSKESLSVSVIVKNIDKNSFPFTIGWHPYFASEDLTNSKIAFKSQKKVVFDENLITKNLVEYRKKMDLKIANKSLDTCYELKGNKVTFETPKYAVKISTNKKENFLQLYTPANRKTIAIEPMTGISNSFNNKIGLQILAPNQEYKIKWKVHFKKIKIN